MAEAQLLPFQQARARGERELRDPAPAPDAAAAGFEAYYRQHVARVYALCLRLTGEPALAEDCTQECFISAWRALAGFRGESSHGTWLHRIAVNAVLGQRRRGQSDPARSAGELDEAACAVSDASASTGTLDVETALANLPPGARDVVVLVGIYGHSHQEAAEFLGIAVGTSKAQLHRGRQLLARQLGLSVENA